MAKLMSAEDMNKMRAAGRLAGQALRFAGTLVRPGVSTDEINNQVHNWIVERGAYPSPLNYKGFPKSICTSVNEVICHGIPSAKEILKEGDIINIDVTVTLNGYFGDTSRTFYVGGASAVAPERRHVTDVSEESLARGLAAVHHGCRVGDIGHAIQSYAESKACSVVRDFVGHGIGTVFHQEPAITHFGRPGTGPKLVRGMCFTIEPMINLGTWRHRLLSDGWTAITEDGLPSAQFEHTISIGRDAIEVLTALPDDPIVARARELGASVVVPVEAP
jgi:methionyl aminopeptidase